ncbi:hypothetical protein ACQP2X_30485 [Actinoplanes sp. CA-131856]
MPVRREDDSDPALDHLLGALRAPATAEERHGEQAMAAAMAAEYRRAPKPNKRLRTLIASTVTAVALLLAGSTAVAAQTGNLPLFSKPDATTPPRTPVVPAPAPTPATAPEPTPAPSRSSTRPAVPRADWCAAWHTAAGGGRPMNGRDRRDLIAAAGGEASVAAYCGTATPTEPAKKGKPAKSKKPKPTGKD